MRTRFEDVLDALQRHDDDAHVAVVIGAQHLRQRSHRAAADLLMMGW